MGFRASLAFGFTNFTEVKGSTIEDYFLNGMDFVHSLFTFLIP
jgi:hypothetical protein